MASGGEAEQGREGDAHQELHILNHLLLPNKSQGLQLFECGLALVPHYGSWSPCLRQISITFTKSLPLRIQTRMGFENFPTRAKTIG